MAIYNATTLDAVLKELYSGQTVTKMAYDAKARPFLTMLKKNTNFQGVIYPLPVEVDDGAGVSYDFSTAQSGLVASQMIQFQMDVQPRYTFAKITTDALLRTRGNSGAFVQGLKLAIDNAINRMANSIESALFRDGSGSIGTVSALSNSNKTISLVNADDVVNFSVGQEIVAADTTASALRSSTSSTVASVDRDLGTVTFDATIPAECDAYAGDYLFLAGDYDSASDLNVLRGLEAWVPATAPSSGDSFFGVDRSTDATRLAGLRYTGSSGAIEESIVGGAARLGRESGASPDTALMSFTTFRRLTNELGSKVQRDAGGKAVAGFDSVEVYGPRGIIKCIPCTFCPSDVIWLLTIGSWQLISMEEPIRIADDDGLRIVRVYNADQFEARVASYSNLACTAPGKNARISL